MTDMTTEITIANGDGELVPWTDALPWTALGMDDLAPRFPLIKIATPVSRMAGAEKHGGDFWHSDREGEANEYTDALDIVILSRLRTRAMFEPNESEPVCRSSDGVLPVMGQPLWEKTSVKVRDGNGSREVGLPHGEPVRCGTCFFSMWGAGNEPPPCRESDVFLVDRGMGDLAQLRVSGKNLSPIRDFLKTKVVPKRVPPFAYRLHLRTERKTKGGNTWHEIVALAERLTNEEASTYARLLSERHAAFMSDAVEEWDTTPPVTDDGSDPVWAGEAPRTGAIVDKAPYLNEFEAWRKANKVTPEEIAAVVGQYDTPHIDAWIAGGDTRSINSLQSAILSARRVPA